jgi:hypothetical protein
MEMVEVHLKGKSMAERIADRLKPSSSLTWLTPVSLPEVDRRGASPPSTIPLMNISTATWTKERATFSVSATIQSNTNHQENENESQVRRRHYEQ